jgi:hypothetical protein
MDLGLRSLRGGARADKNPGGIYPAAERPREKIRAASGNLGDPCRSRDRGGVAKRRAGSDSGCDGCQDQPIADRGASRDSIHQSRGLEPDAGSNRQRGASGWFAHAETQSVSDDSTEDESALGRGATKKRNPVAHACDPDRHYDAGTCGQRHARFAHDQPDGQDPAVALHPAAADPHAGADSTHNARAACRCGDHSSHHPAACVHTAGETTEPSAAIRSANTDSCWNDRHGAATRST